MLQHAARHHVDRSLLHKRLEHCTQRHRHSRPSSKASPSPLGRHKVTENIHTLEGLGLKPYLLHEMDNHIGAVTKVEYSPSIHFYLKDQRRPETRWKTTLPFPVHVVSRVEVIDHFSKGKLTTEYHYHHGYWDGAEREFRGFGMVEQRDTESF